METRLNLRNFVKLQTVCIYFSVLKIIIKWHTIERPICEENESRRNGIEEPRFHTQPVLSLYIPLGCLLTGKKHLSSEASWYSLSQRDLIAARCAQISPLCALI